MLRLPHVYVVGRSMHSNIGTCWEGQQGTLDLTFWSLDLGDYCSNSQPMKTGLGTLAKEAMAMTFDPIKNPRKKKQW